MAHRPSASSLPPFPPLLVLLSGVLAISTGAIFARLADAPALVIAAYRVGLATVLLAPWAWGYVRYELYGLSRHDYQLAVCAGMSLAVHFATWIASLDYTSVANSVVLVNMHPLWVGLAAPFLSHDRLSRRMWVSIVLSLLGGVIIGVGDLTLGARALWGDGLAVVGGLGAAFYLLLGRRLRRTLSLLAYIMLCYGSAAAILWALVLVLRLPVTGFSPSTYSAFVAMALIPQIIGHSSYNWALRWLSTTLVAVSLLGEPIGSTLLAYLLFDEGLTWAKAIGGTCILGAIGLAAWRER